MLRKSYFYLGFFQRSNYQSRFRILTIPNKKALNTECYFYKPKLASYSIGFGASQGRPHVASLSFLTDRTKVQNLFWTTKYFSLFLRCAENLNFNKGLAHYTFFSSLRYENKVYWALRGFKNQWIFGESSNAERKNL